MSQLIEMQCEINTGQLATSTPDHRSCELEQLFERAFGEAYKTRLMGGASEPWYLPAEAACEELHYLQLLQRRFGSGYKRRATIFYREDFFASALHETAHWCIAGEQRRQQIDFGYWYVGDGRDSRQQRDFMAVEVKPQAIELLFSLAAGYPFKPSIDNLDAVPTNSSEELRQQTANIEFASAIHSKARGLLHEGLPERASHFLQVLGAAYAREVSSSALNDRINELVV